MRRRVRYAMCLWSRPPGEGPRLLPCVEPRSSYSALRYTTVLSYQSPGQMPWEDLEVFTMGGFSPGGVCTEPERLFRCCCCCCSSSSYFSSWLYFCFCFFSWWTGKINLWFEWNSLQTRQYCSLCWTFALTCWICKLTFSNCVL